MANYMAEVAKLLGVERRQRPTLDQVYYSVKPNGNLDWNVWDNDEIDLNFYILGNCYLIREEAVANRDKWVEFYASDEIIEVQL